MLELAIAATGIKVAKILPGEFLGLALQLYTITQIQAFQIVNWFPSHIVDQITEEGFRIPK